MKKTHWLDLKHSRAICEFNKNRFISNPQFTKDRDKVTCKNCLDCLNINLRKDFGNKKLRLWNTY